MKKRFEKIETEKDIEKIYRVYFWEFILFVSIIMSIIDIYLYGSTDTNYLLVFISIGFDKLLDGKDEMIKLSTKKDK